MEIDELKETISNLNNTINNLKESINLKDDQINTIKDSIKLKEDQIKTLDSSLNLKEEKIQDGVFENSNPTNKTYFILHKNRFKQSLPSYSSLHRTQKIPLLPSRKATVHSKWITLRYINSNIPFYKTSPSLRGGPDTDADLLVEHPSGESRRGNKEPACGTGAVLRLQKDVEHACRRNLPRAGADPYLRVR